MSKLFICYFLNISIILLFLVYVIFVQPHYKGAEAIQVKEDIEFVKGHLQLEAVLIDYLKDGFYSEYEHRKLREKWREELDLLFKNIQEKEAGKAIKDFMETRGY